MTDANNVSQLVIRCTRRRTMRRSNSLLTRCLAAVVFLIYGSLVGAVEIKVLAAEAFKPAFDDIAPEFERASGHKVTVAYATAGVLRNRIRGGEPADVAIMPKSTFDPLV